MRKGSSTARSNKCLIPPHWHYQHYCALFPADVLQTPADQGEGWKNISFYVSQMGGTRSINLMRIACEMWDWCLHRGVTLSGFHLPGLSNQTADWESREVQTSVEWKLKVESFHRICVCLGPCKTDLLLPLD